MVPEEFNYYYFKYDYNPNTYIDKYDISKSYIHWRNAINTGDTDGDDVKPDWHPIPDKVIKNGPALVVFWCDGTKTIVKRKKGEKDDLYHAFCAALAKKIYGSNSQIHKMVELIYDETDKKSKK